MTIYQEKGQFKAFDKVNIVRMVHEKGATIAKHSHPNENIIFTCTAGQVEMTIGGTLYTVNQGDSLSFDGDTTIEGIFTQDGQVVVVLIEK